MNARHTPGPWQQGDSAASGKGYAICSGPFVVATVNGTGYPIGKGSSPESDANARLIAAAPDLLALVAEGADLCAYEEPDEDTVAEFRQRCKDALAKAR